MCLAKRGQASGRITARTAARSPRRLVRSASLAAPFSLPPLLQALSRQLGGVGHPATKGRCSHKLLCRGAACRTRVHLVVREDSHQLDRLQQALEAAGIRVWRDTADLWPGEDWRVKIRRAITDNTLVFIACFSSRSAARDRSYQNEELLLAIEQLRLRRPDDPWLIPVRLDDCEIPDSELRGGRTLASIDHVDLFGGSHSAGTARLVTAMLRILGHRSSHLRADEQKVSAKPDRSARSRRTPPQVTGERPLPPWRPPRGLAQHHQRRGHH